MSSPSITAERRKNPLLWIGPLVTFAGAVSYFTFFARFPALRDFPWVNLPIVILGVLLTAVGFRRALGSPARFRGKVPGALVLMVSLALGGMFVFYVFSLSYGLPETTAASLAVVRMPDLTLMDQRGRPIDLAQFQGRKVVLTFYRGHW